MKFRVSRRAAAQLAMTCALLAVAYANGGAPGSTSLLTGFIDDRGQEVDARTLRRPVELVVFGYVSCPDACPVTLLAVHQALARLGRAADEVDPIFITVDPVRDTVPVLHRYVAAFDRRIRGYRGDDVLLAQVAHRLDVTYRRRPSDNARGTYSIDHTATLFVLQRDGRVAAQIPHVDDSAGLADAIVMAVTQTQACMDNVASKRSFCLADPTR